MTCGFEERIRVQESAAAVTRVNEAIRATKMIVSGGVGLTELRAPLVDRLVGDHDPAGQHHLLHLAEAEREAVIKPHAMAYDFYRVAKPSVRRHLDTHQPQPFLTPNPTIIPATAS